MDLARSKHDPVVAIPVPGLQVVVGAARSRPETPPCVQLVDDLDDLDDLDGLYRDHHGFVWQVVRRLGVQNALVDDAVQDVFLVVYRRLHEFDGRGAVRGLLYGIARRIAKRYRERAQRDCVAVSHEGEGESVDPEQRLAQIEAANVVRDALNALGEHQRMVFVLVEVQDMHVPEIAECLGVNVNTVYSRLRLAREHVRRAVTRDLARRKRGSHASER